MLFLFCERMFFGPTIGGVITQKLNFEWGAGFQGGITFIAVSTKISQLDTLESM